ncbi:hypothetical protein BT96DRAFT_1097790 [Gymnopus androsaceus JB14]|uniref:Uncharacterized protein n=1 Tax=Gymnopus androsaceus JB14 TaxID=1447944 RepID=A0A6A4GG56_9AGAR|nr:hypothetical protein BT96DRAFT_1097790 [Gymnopus androsaceus JB14]
MSGFQSSLLKPKVQKNLDDNTESQKVDNGAGKQPKKVQLEAIPPWERKQCPIPGYDLEAMEAMRAEASPTPTLIELDEEDIPLDLEQRGIKYVAFASRKRLSLRSRAVEQAARPTHTTGPQSAQLLHGLSLIVQEDQHVIITVVYDNNISTRAVVMEESSVVVVILETDDSKGEEAGIALA